MNEKLAKYIEKARELRNYLEKSEVEDVVNTNVEEEDEDSSDEQKSKKYQIIGTVKKVSGLSDKDENGASVSIVAVKVSTSKTFNAMGRSVKFPAGSIIPVIASNVYVSAGDKVTLEFDVNKLMFKII